MAKLTLTDIASGYQSTTVYNANNALIEAALENTLSRDGTSPNTMSANLDMNSNRVTNVTDGADDQDAVTVSQLNAASVVANTTTAALTTLADAGGNYAAGTVEAAFTELASTSNGEGASIIGIEDAAGDITATDVEGALAEIAADLDDNYYTSSQTAQHTAVALEGTFPYVNLYETDGPSEEKRWRLGATLGNLELSTTNDANDAVTIWATFTRVGNSSLTFDNNGIQFDMAGALVDNFKVGTEVVTATNVITAAESGTTFFLNAAGGFTSTLPAPAAGLKYTFIVTTAPTTAYVVTTNSGANILYGTYQDVVGELVSGVAQDTINFVANTSLVGDRLEVISDGTNWYYTAVSAANGGITTSQT